MMGSVSDNAASKTVSLGAGMRLSLFGFHYLQMELDAIDVQKEILYISLNLSAACNYRCRYCFVGDSRTPVDRLMSMEILQRTRTDAHAMGARVLVIPGEGEPLLEPRYRPLNAMSASPTTKDMGKSDE